MTTIYCINSRKPRTRWEPYKQDTVISGYYCGVSLLEDGEVHYRNTGFETREPDGQPDKLHAASQYPHIINRHPYRDRENNFITGAIEVSRAELLAEVERRKQVMRELLVYNPQNT